MGVDALCSSLRHAGQSTRPAGATCTSGVCPTNAWRTSDEHLAFIEHKKEHTQEHKKEHPPTPLSMVWGKRAFARLTHQCAREGTRTRVAKISENSFPF